MLIGAGQGGASAAPVRARCSTPRSDAPVGIATALRASSNRTAIDWSDPMATIYDEIGGKEGVGVAWTASTTT